MVFLLCHHRVISPPVTPYIAPFAVSPQSFVQLCSKLDLEMEGIRSLWAGKNWNQSGGASCETTARFRGQSSEEPSIVSGEKMWFLDSAHFTMWKGAGISIVWNGLLERCFWRNPEMILWSALLCICKYVCVFLKKPSYAHRICRVMYFVETELPPNHIQCLVSDFSHAPFKASLTGIWAVQTVWTLGLSDVHTGSVPRKPQKVISAFYY